MFRYKGGAYRAIYDRKLKLDKPKPALIKYIAQRKELEATGDKPVTRTVSCGLALKFIDSLLHFGIAGSNLDTLWRHSPPRKAKGGRELGR